MPFGNCGLPFGNCGLPFGNCGLPFGNCGLPFSGFPSPSPFGLGLGCAPLAGSRYVGCWLNFQIKFLITSLGGLGCGSLAGGFGGFGGFPFSAGCFGGLPSLPSLPGLPGLPGLGFPDFGLPASFGFGGLGLQKFNQNQKF